MSVETAPPKEPTDSALQIIVETVITMIRGVAFSVSSFIIFFLCPVGLYATVSVTSTVPLWFVAFQLLMFLFMAQHGLPILYAQMKRSF